MTINMNRMLRIRPESHCRRGALKTAVAGILALAAAPHGVRAQGPAWPTKPIRFVVNFPPGGPLDLAARAVSERISAALGQPVVVDNRPGAGGNIGAEAVARAAPDGYTVLFSIDTPFTVNPTIYPSMPFKLADLRPLVLIGTSGSTLAVHPSVGVATLAEFVAKAKTQDVTFSSAGNGSPGHLAATMFAERTGARVNHIPYKGNAPAVLALVAGEVQAGILATPGVLPHLKDGKLRALAVTSRQRSPLAAEVPTVAEAGLAALEFEFLYLTLLPTGVPPAVASMLEKEIVAAIASTEVQQRLRKLDLQPSGETGAALGQRLDRLREHYAPVIRKTGMKVE